MKLKGIKIFILLLLLCQVFYGASNQVLTREKIEEIRSSVKLSKDDQVIMNALTNNKLTDLVLNHKFLSKHNDLFNHKIETRGITDQKRSGRCWLFAGLNVLRPKVIKQYNLKDFEFSQSYLFFWDKLEKANTFLEYIIATLDRDLYDRELQIFLKRPITDGGYWSYVVNLIEKYGVVPKSVMPETYQSRNSWSMGSILAMLLRQFAVELRTRAAKGAAQVELRKRKDEMLKTIYRILVLNLGEPPTQFVWRYETKKGEPGKAKTYTPLQFYREVVATKITDYVALMNYPGKPYNRLYRLDKARNMFEGNDPTYANLESNELAEFALKSVLNNEPVWFACDIMVDKDSKHGVLSTQVLDYPSLLNIDLKMNKEERIKYWESSGNHAMVLVGVDTIDKRPVKWLVEDSHGADSGHNGHWTMYDDWFNEYVYTVIINKKYLPDEIKQLFTQKPEILPPWDPMFMTLLTE